MNTPVESAAVLPWRALGRRVAASGMILLLAACGTAGGGGAAPPSGSAPSAPAPAPRAAASVPKGEEAGRADTHTAASALAAISGAQVALPAAPGRPAYFGKLASAPASAGTRYPVVLFLHGSSGLGLAAIGEWQRWLAEHGVASLAPDSFALPERITYKSPVSKPFYERIHRLRASEIPLGLQALNGLPWADAKRVVLAGTSEGAVAVARHNGAGVVGRMLFAWSCEDNYMVSAHQTAIPLTEPVLNVISSTDPFFSQSNGFLGNPAAMGHCGRTLAAHKNATVVLIAGAPHTLLGLPAARHAALGFVRDVLKP